ncbi:MAG: diguanylate cyclase [Thermodesulfobacteriota bacterium]
MDKDKGKILVVDDDAFSRTLFTDILSEGGFSVRAVSSGPAALKIVEADEPLDIVITDLVMPGMTGLDVLERTKQHNALIDVIVVTGHGTLETAIAALKKAAFDYVKKPVDEEDLLLTVNNCMEKKKLLAENRDMRESLKLFEVSRAITGTLDINKLYEITIDAFLQIGRPEDKAILAFYGDDGKTLDIKAIRHMGLDLGEKVLADLLERLEERRLKRLRGVKVLSCPGLGRADGAGPGEPGSVLVAPMLSGGVPTGYLFLCGLTSGEVSGTDDIRNARFLAEQASQAFNNARKYIEAKEMAFIDSLTNLYNSKYLDKALERELSRADRLMMPLSVLFLDLDNFKQINDTNDHLVGSKVLVEIGKVLLKCVRDVDTVIRYGGDEYVIVLVDADSDSAFMVAERARESIETQHFLTDEGLDIRVTISIGVSTYPVHTKNKKELLRMADKAMYSAKGISKNMVYLAPVGDGGPGAAALKEK